MNLSEYKHNQSLLQKLRKPRWSNAILLQQTITCSKPEKSHGIFCITWRHIKVFAKCFHGKSVCWVIWWATRKGKPARFLEILVILYEAFRRNFWGKLDSSFCYHTISVRNCFCVCICWIFRFAYLAYYCFCAMLFSVSH